MRKKTIKSYFFNTPYKNPAIPYLFCFSKRAFRQNKLMLKILTKPQRLQSKCNSTTISMNQYKTLINQRIHLNQWMLNNTYTHFFFKNSYFYTNNSLYKITNKTKFVLWFKFKNKFHRFFLRFIKNYAHLGILSSHFVHILSRKNLTYQVWSKYRARLFTINNTTEYATNCTSVINSYSWSLLILLYGYTLYPATIAPAHTPENSSLNLPHNSNTKISAQYTGTTTSYLYTVNERVNIHNVVVLKNLTDRLQMFFTTDDNDISDTLKLLFDAQLSQHENLILSRYFNTYVLSKPALAVSALLHYYIICYIWLYK